MEFDLVTIWGHMGFLNRLISITLLVMGMSCLAIYIERHIALARTIGNANSFSAQATEPLESGDFDTVLGAAEEVKNNHLSELAKVAIGAYRLDRDGNLTPLERSKREVERYLDAFDAQLRRGMSWLASVGSISPFVGLLGTVIGIIVAFQSISLTGSGGISSVAGGISEALVETALGLMVAIPAVLMYNHLSSRMDNFQLALDQSAGKILDLIEEYDGRSSR